MKNSNIRTMEFLGKDFWDRPVYKCVETKKLWKDVTCGKEHPELYSCQNEFDGEPDSPIKPDLEIRFINQYQENKYSFQYQLLDRLRTDCEYYLGNGNRYSGHLWAGDEQGQIEKMKELWNGFPEDQKPEWLTMEQILEYEKLMTSN